MGSADKDLMKSDRQLHWTVLQTKVGRGRRKTTVRVAAVVIRTREVFNWIRGHMVDKVNIGRDIR